MPLRCLIDGYASSRTLEHPANYFIRTSATRSTPRCDALSFPESREPTSARTLHPLPEDWDFLRPSRAGPPRSQFTVANSVANPKEYLRPYGRVTNTWKAKISS